MEEIRNEFDVMDDNNTTEVATVDYDEPYLEDTDCEESSSVLPVLAGVAIGAVATIGGKFVYGKAKKLWAKRKSKKAEATESEVIEVTEVSNEKVEDEESK